MDTQIDEQAALEQSRVEYRFLREDLKKFLPLDSNKNADAFVRRCIQEILGEDPPTPSDWVGVARFLVESLQAQDAAECTEHQAKYPVFSTSDALYGITKFMVQVGTEELQNTYGAPTILFDGGVKHTPFLPNGNVTHMRVVDVATTGGVNPVLDLLSNNGVPKDTYANFKIYRFVGGFYRIVVEYMKAN